MALDGSDRTPVFSSTTTGNRCPDAGTDPAYAPQGDAIVFDRQGRRGEQLFTTTVDGSGNATGSAQPVTHSVFLAGGANWAPVDGPPTETPEAPWAVGLPIAGVGAGGALLALRRRRDKPARCMPTGASRTCVATRQILRSVCLGANRCRRGR
jgi:hypothetical protein